MRNYCETNRSQLKSCLDIPLILMPHRPSLSRTYHSASHRPNSVIEDLALSRDLSRNERMQQNPDLRCSALAPQSGNVTGQVE